VNLRRRRDAVTRAERELDRARASLAQSLRRLQKDGSDALTPMRIVGAGFALGVIGGLLRPWATASSTLVLITQSLRGVRSLTALLKAVDDVIAAARPDHASGETGDSTS
jgi:hypothetical protein